MINPIKSRSKVVKKKAIKKQDSIPLIGVYVDPGTRVTDYLQWTNEDGDQIRFLLRERFLTKREKVYKST